MGEFIKVGVKSGVELQEYKGAYSIVSGFQDEQGKVTFEWVRAEHWDKDMKKKVPNEKNSPLKVYIGNQETAKNVLKTLLEQITGQTVHIGDGPGGDDSEVPF